MEKLKEEVFLANLELDKQNLIKHTWGNASGINRKLNLFVIKPSGVKYEDLSVDDMVVCDLEGKVVSGKLEPSSDTLTHAYIYKKFPNVGGIVHTHSTWATSWSQAGRNIPIYGTTHADAFFADVPCTELISKDQTNKNYVKETGKIIVDTFNSNNLDPISVPGILVRGHGPFSFGKNATEAAYNAVVLEEISQTAFYSEMLNHNIERLPKYIVETHYYRKHGKDATYGQKGEIHEKN